MKKNKQKQTWCINNNYSINNKTSLILSSYQSCWEKLGRHECYRGIRRGSFTVVWRCTISQYLSVALLICYGYNLRLQQMYGFINIISYYWIWGVPNTVMHLYYSTVSILELLLDQISYN